MAASRRSSGVRFGIAGCFFDQGETSARAEQSPNDEGTNRSEPAPVSPLELRGGSLYFASR